jgi:hypothetical protein
MPYVGPSASLDPLRWINCDRCWNSVAEGLDRLLSILYFLLVIFHSYSYSIVSSRPFTKLHCSALETMNVILNMVRLFSFYLVASSSGWGWASFSALKGEGPGGAVYGRCTTSPSHGSTSKIFFHQPFVPPFLLSTVQGLSEKSIAVANKGHFFASTDPCFSGSIKVLYPKDRQPCPNCLLTLSGVLRYRLFADELVRASPSRELAK